MRFLISSGSGVDEVCRALWHFLKWLEKRFDFEVVNKVYANCPNCYKSVIIKSSDERLLLLEGVLMWQSVSPFRPKHKRKNWFFEFRKIDSSKVDKFLEGKVIYQVMRSPKKGGQNVNKRCSGVRAIYKDLNLEAISFDSRSQAQNRALALQRLKQKFYNLEESRQSDLESGLWKSAKNIKRGDAIKVFVGKEFREEN